MKELDVVKLVKPFQGLDAGIEGVIVGEFDGKAFEVEFFDKRGDTIDVLTTPATLLSLVKEYLD